MINHQKSTYALLVRSEEKSRTALEAVAYVTFIVGVVVAMWQFVHQPVNVPAGGITRASEVTAANSPS